MTSHVIPVSFHSYFYRTGVCKVIMSFLLFCFQFWYGTWRSSAIWALCFTVVYILISFRPVPDPHGRQKDDDGYRSSVCTWTSCGWESPIFLVSLVIGYLWSAQNSGPAISVSAMGLFEAPSIIRMILSIPRSKAWTQLQDRTCSFVWWWASYS